jgi:hypothetical protein
MEGLLIVGITIQINTKHVPLMIKRITVFTAKPFQVKCTRESKKLSALSP